MSDLPGCGCISCIVLAAADRLVDAGFCADVDAGFIALARVMPVPSPLMDLENKSTLESLCSFHGATLYKILLAQKNDQ